MLTISRHNCEMQKAFRYRFYPTPEQENLLRRTLGCVRLIYNKMLHERTTAFYERQERISYNQSSSLLTGWKKQDELSFLNEVSCVPLQQGLRHLQQAFKGFWDKRTTYPTFKKKRNGGSAEFTRSAFNYVDGQLFLAKNTEPLPIRWSRQIPKGCEPSTVTVRLDAAGRWFVSLLVDDPTITPLPITKGQTGIDLGITSLATLSTGEKVSNPKHFDSLYKRLKKAQKALSGKEKGSSNRYKAQLRVARIQARIKDSRQDYWHKLTTRLIRDNQVIAIEDLNVCGMVRNHKLARAISDCGWSEMVRQLEYKAEWYGRKLIKIDRWFPSSKRCGNCGHTVSKLPLNIREWDCPECGTHHDRDINAANNILAQGLGLMSVERV